MTERPILFSAPMVRAILEGRKSQTRRIVKWRGLQPGLNLGFSGLSVARSGSNFVLSSPTRTSHEYRSVPQPCPYGLSGDRLWVRETWRTAGDDGRADYLAPSRLQEHPVWYDADGAATPNVLSGKTRVSIHMPRWASRILLEVVDVRVERLQAISEADARAEGIEPRGRFWRDYLDANAGVVCSKPVNSFRSLWASRNGADSWAANPWVWVVGFRRLET